MIKGAIALVLILFTLLFGSEPLPSANPTAFGLLLLSGAIAIGFGDTAYFETLNCLGGRRTLLMIPYAGGLGEAFRSPPERR